MNSIPDIPAHPIRCGPFKVTRRGLARAAVLTLVHLVIVAHLWQWYSSGKTITPVEPSEAATTIETGFVNAGFLLFASLIIITFIFGRFFCGWACHLVAYQDLCAWILKKFGMKPQPVRSRLLLFIPFFAAIHMFAWPSIYNYFNSGEIVQFRGWLITTDNLWERFSGIGMSALTLAVDGFLIIWWLGAKGFCSYGCPYGAVFNLADRLAPLRIRVTDACNGCGHCTSVCTSNVRVHEEVRLYKNVADANCMKCLDCVSSCPKDALYYGLGAPGFLTKKPSSKPAKHYDFSWPAEIVLVLLFAGAFLVYLDLYGVTPRLLAYGIAAMFAIGTVAFVRMLRSTDFTFQSHALRANGKFTKSGFAAIAIYSAFAIFTAHSAAVQYFTKTGEKQILAARRERTREPFLALRDSSRENYEMAEKLGLFPNAKLQLALASISYNRGDAPEAERRLREAVRVEPRLIEAWVQLSQLVAQRSAADARTMIDTALEHSPGNAALLHQRDTLKAR